MTINRDNLARLAAYLESLPLDYADFDMAEFIDPEEEVENELKIKYALENGGVGAVCGTVACAIGHGPSAGLLFLKDEITSEDGLAPRPDWRAYTRRAFGVSMVTPEFLWMFGAPWEGIDNTHRGAAARIRYYLANGVPDVILNHPYSLFLPSDVEDDSIYRSFLVS